MSGPYSKGRPKKYDAMANRGSKPQNVAGEYRIKDKDNNLKYLGISNDIDRRIKEHKKSGRINENDRYVEWMPARYGASYDDIRKHERQKIIEKKPTVNARGGGAGPNPKKMNYAGSAPTNDYQSTNEKKKGCYVATCVYGSYDCPEVWTLRRYRDYALAQTVWGRTFIRMYYSISPIMVRICGNTRMFKFVFRRLLDSKVERLNRQGYMNTKYDDPDW